MTKKHTSNVAEVESADSAPSETSASQTPSDEESLTEAMLRMTDYELVQVALVALAVLHNRAETAEKPEKSEKSE